jgi:hypothetical protein
MLADGEYECVVDSQLSTLRLNNVQVVALSVRGGMAKDKFIWRIFSGVDDWECKGKRVRYVSAGVHEPLSAGINFDHTLPFVAG